MCAWSIRCSMLLMPALLGALPGALAAQATVRVSVGPAGDELAVASGAPALSGDGRFVAFVTAASGATAGDDNEVADVFVEEIATGRRWRASETAAGVGGDGPSFAPRLSRNGRWVAFWSRARNLAPTDGNGHVGDVFVKDLKTGRLEHVSVGGDGGGGDGASTEPAISADGRWVAFTSRARNLVAGDRGEGDDVYLFDRERNAVELLSCDASGRPTGGARPSLSADGDVAAFESFGFDGEAAVVTVVGRRDRWRRCASRDRGGRARTGRRPKVSADGSVVVFESPCSLLPLDRDEWVDVYAFDVRGATCSLVTAPVVPDGRSTADCRLGDVSFDGRRVVVVTAEPFSATDRNGLCDVLVFDRVRCAASYASLGPSGRSGDGESDGRLDLPPAAAVCCSRARRRIWCRATATAWPTSSCGFCGRRGPRRESAPSTLGCSSGCAAVACVASASVAPLCSRDGIGATEVVRSRDRRALSFAVRLLDGNGIVLTSAKTHDVDHHRRLRADLASQQRFLERLCRQVASELDEVVHADGDRRTDLCQRLKNRLTSVADLARLSRGQTQIAREVFDLHTASRAAVANHAFGAAERAVRLRCYVHRDAPRKVVGDPGRLRRVLGDLVAEMLAASEGGDLSVFVGPEPNDEGATAVRFTICDRTDNPTAIHGGRGAEQAGEAVTPWYESLRALLGRMGGRAAAWASELDGTVVSFTVAFGTRLPRRKRAELAAQAPVMLVSKNPKRIEVVTAVLQRSGLMVEIESDQRQVAARLNQARYSLVLMDRGGDTPAATFAARPPGTTQVRMVPILGVPREQGKPEAIDEAALVRAIQRSLRPRGDTRPR